MAAVGAFIYPKTNSRNYNKEELYLTNFTFNNSTIHIFSGYGGYGAPGAVPGFTVPAGPPPGQYGHPAAQQPMPPPASMQYNAAAYHTGMQGLMQQQMQHLQNVSICVICKCKHTYTLRGDKVSMLTHMYPHKP